MKFHKKLFQVRNYFRISKGLSQSMNRSHLIIFFRMTLCKVLFGHNASYYALYGFEDKCISQWSEYINPKTKSRLIRKINPSKYDFLARNKLEFFERCKANNIPTPDVLAILSKNELPVPDNIPVIKDMESLFNFFVQHDNKMLFFKTIDGAYGKGALSVKSKNGGAYKICGEKISLEDILTHCSRYKASFLIQECLAPHEVLKSLMPDHGLGTFRLVTILKKDKQSIKILYALAKIPIGDNIIDNFQHGESGNLVCGVDVTDGKLLGGWGRLKEEHKILRIERHPKTQLVFKEFIVPNWDEILTLVSRAAKIFPELTTIGWDVAITDKGLYILEVNSNYDIDLHQIALNKGLKSDFRNLCNSVIS